MSSLLARCLSLGDGDDASLLRNQITSFRVFLELQAERARKRRRPEKTNGVNEKETKKAEALRKRIKGIRFMSLKEGELLKEIGES